MQAESEKYLVCACIVQYYWNNLCNCGTHFLEYLTMDDDLWRLVTVITHICFRGQVREKECRFSIFLT